MPKNAQSLHQMPKCRALLNLLFGSRDPQHHGKEGDDQESCVQREFDGSLLNEERLGLLAEQSSRRESGNSRLLKKAISWKFNQTSEICSSY